MALNAIDDLMDLDRPLGRFFDLYFPWAYRRWPALATRPFMPSVDIFSRNGDLVMRFELPGIDPAKDVTVSLAEGELTVRGERKEEKEVEEGGYYRKESSYGLFERHLPVPKGVTEKDIKATYADGVLEITVPGAVRKEAASKPAVIPVKAEKTAKS